jgi:hypothetical protein
MVPIRVGDPVRIRSAPEIAATLDENGTLDGMPFMPEMLEFCGRTAVMHRSAHKTCDATTMRKLVRTVHLEGLRCSGASHGGCQAGCRLFWNEAWLEPVDGRSDELRDEARDDGSLARLAERSVRLHGRDARAGTFACQATEIPRVGTPLPWWMPSQYIVDVRSSNIRLADLLRALPAIVFNGYQEISRRLLPRALLIRGGHSHPFVYGRRRKTPTARLDLVPGERVAIRPWSEIVDTLDHDGLNRGLSFDFDMLPWCGANAVVARRIEAVIDEHSGRLTELRNPCVVLQGVSCQGRYHRFCSRGQDSFWREIWLRRVP